MITAIGLLVGASQLGPLEAVGPYKPAFEPSFVKGIRPYQVELGNSNIRGRRTIESRYVIDRPLPELAPAMLKEVKVVFWSVRKPPDLNRVEYLKGSRQLEDRWVSVSLRKGSAHALPSRLRKGREKGKKPFSLVILTEGIYREGPLPSSWPPAASKTPRLPAGFPDLGVPQLRDDPLQWSRSITPVGAMHYNIFWQVQTSNAAELLRKLKSTGYWGHWRAPQAGHRKGLLSIRVKSLAHRSATEVRISWVDPRTARKLRPRSK